MLRLCVLMTTLLQVIVLLIGTNNRDQTPEQILGGIRTVVDAVVKKQPQAALFVAVSLLYFFSCQHLTAFSF